MKTISRNLSTSQTLIQYMHIRGYTLEKIAEMADIHPSTLKKIRSGKTKNPTRKTFGKIMNFYCCLILNESSR